ncbi:MAG TPA: 23S rRNA (uracil(1939)-C(5))-methyltransferase RlmD [Candidatus Limnocylindrales bacterium]|nr:23S rRNA (uracil(1939)-C(5))-methyltransferase RlmD [Candidatus Limnocylindrales bacterium]
MPKLDHEVEITALSYGPYGIGRVDGKALMIPNTAPGDRIAARIVEAKERYAIGDLIRVINPSPLRQNPPCSYVGRCGGCSWQHLRYDAQLKAKQQSVEDALRRIGKLSDFDLRPIIPSASEYHYRRRIRLQVDGAKRLGFYGAGSHDLVQIESCEIAAAPLNRAIEPLRRWLGELRSKIEHIELVNGDEPDEIIAIAQTADTFAPIDEPACDALVNPAETIAGLIVRGRDGRRLWGKPWITVKLSEEMALKLDADLFVQVNSEGNRQMLDKLLASAKFHDRDQVLELYCGAGNFTLPIATRVRRIVAVEGFRATVANGKLNAQNYRLDNIDWLCAPVPRAVSQLRRQRQKFTKIVLDPPRTGAKGIETDLAALGAETIAYISCNPTTLARDLTALTKFSYKLGFVQPIDFFPHTFHIESLAVMMR